MHPGYRIRNQGGIYFITFALVEWVDVFTRKEYAEIVIESLQFWQQSNQPKELETNHFMEQKLQYIHHNPVVAGIVSRPEDYVCSSARNYAGEIELLEVEFLE